MKKEKTNILVNMENKLVVTRGEDGREIGKIGEGY